MGLELNEGNKSSDIRYISRSINKERTVKLKNGSLVYGRTACYESFMT